MIRTAGADQALRRRSPPSTASTSTSREGDVYGFLGANGSGKTTTVRMLLGLVLATVGHGRGARASRCRGRPARCCRRSARWSRARRRTRTCPGGRNLALLRRAWAPAGERGRGAAGSTTRSSGSASAASTTGRCAAYSLGMRQRLGLAAALLRQPAAARARRADQRPGPAGHPRDPRAAARAQRGRHHDLPVQPPARRGRADVHPGRRPRPRPAGAPGASSTCCSGRPAGSWCARPTSPRARALLDGQVESYDGDGCWSACADAGRAQRAAWSRRGPGRRARARAAQPRARRARGDREATGSDRVARP